jgi:hypothetical protein
LEAAWLLGFLKSKPKIQAKFLGLFGRVYIDMGKNHVTLPAYAGSRGDENPQTRVNLDVLRRETVTPCPPVVPDFIGLALTPYTLNVMQALCMGFLGDEFLMCIRGGVRNMTVGFFVGVVCKDDTAPELTK